MYLRGTWGGCPDTTYGTSNAVSSDRSFKMRNGVCIYHVYGEAALVIDVNGLEGPNDALDQFYVEFNPTEGITTDMPKVAISSYAGGIRGCAEATGTTCTKCYCSFALSSGKCKRTYTNGNIQGCYNISVAVVYSDSSCTSVANDKGSSYCEACATEKLSETKVYIKSNGNCVEYGKIVTCAPPTDCVPL